jgi:hypothetical protein
MASASLRILGILFSVVRFSEPRLLRQLLGRESDRKSEALVDLTPLSVDPVTSAYTPGGVEIESSFNRDRVAFVCDHLRDTEKVKEAIEAFKMLMLARNGKVDASRDFATILGLKGLNLPIEDVTRLVSSIVTDNSTIDPTLVARASSATLFFHSTGIIPSQTTLSVEILYSLLQQDANFSVGLLFCFLMIGIQILGYYKQRPRNNAQLQALLTGTCGYIGTALFALFLLAMLQDAAASLQPCVRFLLLATACVAIGVVRMEINVISVEQQNNYHVVSALCC